MWHACDRHAAADALTVAHCCDVLYQQMRVPIALLVLGVAMALQALHVAAYDACNLGDAACASDSNFNGHCCPVGADLDWNTVPISCSGGVPAGCAATGRGQPTMVPCDSSGPSCTPTNTQGCKTWSASNGATAQVMGLGYATGYPSPVCPSGLRPRISSMTVISTKGYSSYAVGLVDQSFPNDPSPGGMSSSVLLQPTTTNNGCYKLALPYQFKGSSNNVYVACSNSAGCTGTIQTTISCEEPPSDTLCLSGPATATLGLSSPCASNPTRFNANDNMQYCCADTASTPTFGTFAGACTCRTCHTRFQLA